MDDKDLLQARRAVLISIRPKWCEKILRGEKSIEIRKNRPKLKPPFKCYIYCTNPKHEYEDYIELEYPLPNFFGEGKVIGEFVCDRIFSIDVLDNGCIRDWNYEHLEMACLDYDELAAYIGKGNRGYGWHISDLRIYDHPRELTEFRRSCPNDLYCEACAMYSNNNGICNNGALPLRRPPQSWCYVEEDT